MLGLTYLLSYPNIDRLMDEWQTESKPFFAALNKLQRKELKKYIYYRSSKNKEGFSYNCVTTRTLDLIDEGAKNYYEQQIKFNQLTFKF